MSTTTSTLNVRGELSACNNIPYSKYFKICSYENWSLDHYVSLIIDNYKFAEKDNTHLLFFSTLQNINNDLCACTYWIRLVGTHAKDFSSKKPNISCFCPDEDIPLQANGSNNLLVDFKQNMKVPRESTYDAEMYRILTNWLAKVYGYEVTCDDGDYHHFYCDLTIKKADVPNPVAIIEILASGSVWIVHFSREDSIIMNQYWPDQK
ncbi:1265_t:CDS:2 [Diversispora eburnea]|uniref:1265_t:CDS:1 n=1 Tax=Diversispora eburnea TaxID=1213867 RepID=A0A9N9FC29_9GLOM|nr:1265_t:CDS:2 [Diversispora eburnea]